LVCGAAVLCLLAACTTDARTPPTPHTVTTAPSTTVVTVPPTTTTTAPPIAPKPVTIRYRIERHVDDDATTDFARIVDATLADARGWSQAMFRFERDDDAPYVIVLAEGDEVDRLCLPYDTYGKYSCQNGPVVAINADRWRVADPKWTGDLPTYRQMLVNHEVGHLLGQKHPRPQCPQPGQPAPVMNQQSTELNGCLPNPWPLAWEVELAARHDKALAPPPGA
jgi:hypothetical protein